MHDSSFKNRHFVAKEIVHGDRWPLHLVTDWTRFLKTKIGSLNLGRMGQNQTQN